MKDLFVVCGTLAKGTFGTVYLCQTKHSNQKVVMKEIRTDLEGENLTAAQNEIAILESLEHPNVIQLLYSYFSKGAFYIIMEYASHGSLQQFIQKRLPNNYLTAQEVMDFFCQILLGLNHIHEKKIVHRDLKCENIFVTGINSDVIKIGDFGISKRLIDNGMAHTLIGTCQYLAPEVCDGQPYNNKSDIWALGCILYEICALEKMFTGTVTTVVLSIAGGRKKYIDAKRYGKQMQELIDLLLRVNPIERPDTKTLMSLSDVFPSLYCLGANLGCIM